LLTRLASERDFVPIPCSFPDARRLLAWLEEEPADVLLIDERWLARLDGRSVRKLRARQPGPRVLVLCDRACSALAEDIVRNRFQGFLLTSGAVDSCVKAIRAVTHGELWMPRAVLEELLARPQAHDDELSETGAAASLTRRERQVVGYVRRGLTNKQIGDALGIREDTVKKHLLNCYAKLGVCRRSQLLLQVASDGPAAR
jgi:DNA-binding NarL/FixJ family response regulator